MKKLTKDQTRIRDRMCYKNGAIAAFFGMAIVVGISWLAGVEVTRSWQLALSVVIACAVGVAGFLAGVTVTLMGFNAAVSDMPNIAMSHGEDGAQSPSRSTPLAP